MKKLTLSVVLLLSAVLMLGGCNGAEKAAPKVAVVDAGKVFQESAPGKAGVAYLEKISAAAQEEFRTLQAEAEKDKSQESMLKMQRALGEIQQRMNAEQQMVIGKLNDAFKKTLDTYRDEKKLEVILPAEQVISFGQASDITKDIIAAMDKVTVTYESEKAPVEAAPEAAPAEVKAEEKAADKDAGKAAEKPAAETKKD
jgi:outer membrane protein